jgi:hypothetical protein
MAQIKLTPEQLRKARAGIEIARKKARDNFRYFVYNVFSASFDRGEFVGGKYIDDVCEHIQNNNRTMDVTGRDHFKSTRLYADIMWNIFIDDGKGWEGQYFSYNEKMASYHLKKIKKMIKRNVFFSGAKDNKPTSEAILDYAWSYSRDSITITPQGLLGGARGVHAERIYVDDPFKTEAKDNAFVLEPAQIKKINDIIIGDLYPMVKKGGYWRIVGTPQTAVDFFFDRGEDGKGGMQSLLKTWITPAIQDEHNKIALWPEWRSYEELAAIRSVNPKKFAKEYMAQPVSTVDSYLDRQQVIDKCTEKQYKWIPHPELYDETVVAGFDIGKKVHPSHLAIFVKKSTTDPDTQETAYSYKQIYSFWMDGWDYYKQVEYINQAIAFFNIDRLRFDNTRAEFEFAIEQKLLNKRYANPVTLNLKNESAFAAYFGSMVQRARVAFINEARQIDQLLSVNNDLKAVAGPGGHGDSFWSCAMAIYEDRISTPGIRIL